MKKIKLIIITLALVFAQGCDNNLSELNVDPNAAETVDPSSLLTTAQYAQQIVSFVPINLMLGKKELHH